MLQKTKLLISSGALMPMEQSGVREFFLPLTTFTDFYTVFVFIALLFFSCLPLVFGNDFVGGLASSTSCSLHVNPPPPIII